MLNIRSIAVSSLFVVAAIVCVCLFQGLVLGLLSILGREIQLFCFISIRFAHVCVCLCLCCCVSSSWCNGLVCDLLCLF